MGFDLALQDGQFLVVIFVNALSDIRSLRLPLILMQGEDKRLVMKISSYILRVSVTETGIQYSP